MYHKILGVSEPNKDEVDWAYGTCGEKERFRVGLLENPEGRGHLGGLGVDGMIVLNRT